ncbi:MAG: delta-class carbonic anhydrase, partial [Alphaproteobacteria bacterium]
MMRFKNALVALLALSAAPAMAAEICHGYGPQTPRDIAETAGSNPRVFALVPAVGEMNLCNIHMHVNAEHKGPGFSVSGGPGEHG